MKIPVHETFQNTIQGEGYWAGTRVDFIRLSGCPVGCHWCDTGYSDGGKNLPKDLRNINELIAELRSSRVVISGGEPMIHPQIVELVEAIESTGRSVSIETSGAYWKDVSSSTWITLSPKQHISPRYPVVDKLWKRANEVKIVIDSGDEWNYYQDSIPTSIPVYLQPEWNNRARAIPTTIELIQRSDRLRLSLQIHKFIGVR